MAVLVFLAAPVVTAEEEAGAGVFSLSIADVTRLALENNFDIQIAKFDAYINRNDWLEAVSIFDTVLSASASFRDDQLKKNSSIFGSKALTNIYAVNLTKKLPTGTTLSLDVSDTREFTNSAFTTLNPSHEAVARLSLEQSLGKNFFGLIDRNEIKITKLDIENSDWTSLERIENSLAQTQKAYWAVVLFSEELDIKREEYKRARALYEIYRKKIHFGLIEDPDLYASEANMIQRENDVLASLSQLNAAKDALLLLLNEESRRVRIAPLDHLGLEGPPVDFSEALAAAIENRKDYKKAKNEIEKKRLSLVNKKNSLWPEIDLEASFARNGLTRKYAKAFDDVINEDNPELFVGVTVKVPLENRKAKGQFNKAKFEKARSLVELKKTERVILTEINDIVTRLGIQAGRVLTLKRVAALQEKKLQAEMKRFRYGRSSSDLLIRYQEDVLGAKLAHERALYQYKLLEIDLKVAQNILLSENWEGQL